MLQLEGKITFEVERKANATGFFLIGRSIRLSLQSKSPEGRTIFLLVFAAAAGAVEVGFINALVELVPDVPKEFFYSLEELTQRLRSPIYEDVIAVFVISDRQSLHDLLTIRPLLRNIRILLILPDQSEDCVSAAHCLYPRYLATFNDDFHEIALVLNKMIGVQALQQVN